MPRFKKVNYEQMELIPVAFDDQILTGTFEYTLNYIVDHKLDLSIFNQRYHNDETGASAYNPAVLLKVILYCYRNGLISSREIEYACETNITVKALSANTIPDFTTIADFVSSMKDEILPLFVNLLMVCMELGLISGSMFALDGCKLPSNASKEWSGTFKDLKKKKEKLQTHLEELLEKHKRNDSLDNGLPLRKEKEQKQVEKIEKKIAKIGRFLEKEKPCPGKRYNEVQSNITDNESAKIKSSHGVIQGYDDLAVVDEKCQVVVYPEAFGNNQEGEFLKLMTRKTNILLKKAGLSIKGKPLAADTNYFSEANLKYLAGAGIRSVIPDQQFRKRDVRFAERDRFKPEKKGKYTIEDFRYDAGRDVYICRNNQELRFRHVFKMKNITYAKYIGRLSVCRDCPFRKDCLKKENTKYRTLQKPLYADNRNYSDEMKKFIDTPEGRDLYSRRMGIVEPVFSNTTHCKGMDRFTLRGKSKVNIQWVLFNIVHNIGKIQVFGGI